MLTNGPGKIPPGHNDQTPMETNPPQPPSPSIGQKRGMTVESTKAEANIPRKKVNAPPKLSFGKDVNKVQPTNYVSPPEKLSATAKLWQRLPNMERKP